MWSEQVAERRTAFQEYPNQGNTSRDFIGSTAEALTVAHKSRYDEALEPYSDHPWASELPVKGAPNAIWTLSVGCKAKALARCESSNYVQTCQLSHVEHKLNFANRLFASRTALVGFVVERDQQHRDAGSVLI